MNLPHVLLPRPHTASRCRMNLPHVLLPRFSLGEASLVFIQKRAALLESSAGLNTRHGGGTYFGACNPFSQP